MKSFKEFIGESNDTSISKIERLVGEYGDEAKMGDVSKTKNGTNVTIGVSGKYKAALVMNLRKLLKVKKDDTYTVDPSPSFTVSGFSDSVVVRLPK